jgi:hypothetical protein
MNSSFLSLSAAVAITVSLAAQQQQSPSTPHAITWFGTWKQGLAEAKRTGRPILLISAAPHCRNISGLW